jgi:hypothetical protein
MRSSIDLDERSGMRSILLYALLALATGCCHYPHLVVPLRLEKGTRVVETYAPECTATYQVRLTFARSPVGNRWLEAETRALGASGIDLTWQIAQDGRVLGEGRFGDKRRPSAAGDDLSFVLASFEGEGGKRYTITAFANETTPDYVEANPRIDVWAWKVAP